MRDATSMIAPLPANAENLDVATARLAGYFIVCIVPALFWTAMIALGAMAFEIQVASYALLGTSLAISGFLAIVFSALTAHGDAEERRN